MAFPYVSLTNEDAGAVCSLPEPHARSEAGFGAKITVIGNTLQSSLAARVGCELRGTHTDPISRLSLGPGCCTLAREGQNVSCAPSSHPQTWQTLLIDHHSLSIGCDPRILLNTVLPAATTEGSELWKRVLR